MVLFPAFWLLWRKRSQSALFVAAFYLFLNWEEIPDALHFFPLHGRAFALSIWVLHSLFMALPWIILYSPHKTLCKMISRTLLITFVLLLPPLGYFVWLQPITAAGILFPHYGFVGLLLTLVLMVLLATCLVRRKFLNIGLIVLLLCFAGFANVRYTKPIPPPHWVAINTHLGDMGTSFTALPLRQVPLIAAANTALSEGAKVIIFPENIAADWLISSQEQWSNTLAAAKLAGADIVLGAQIDWPHSFDNVFILFGADGYHIYPARQPMPFGLWKPWSQNTYRSHWWDSGRMEIQGQTAVYLLCYEQMIPFPVLYSFFHHPQPSVIISGANQWFARMSGYTKQSNVLFANGRLFGVPVLVALNT